MLITTLFSVAKSRFGLAWAHSPFCASATTSFVTRLSYRWYRHYVACSLMLPTYQLLGPLATSMELATTNVHSQSSRKSEKSGSSARRRRITSARLKKSVNAPQMVAVSPRPIPTSLLGRTTHLGLVLNCLLSDTLQPVVKSVPVTQVAWIKCTTLRATARSTQAIQIRPTARANKCKIHLCSISPSTREHANAPHRN